MNLRVIIFVLAAFLSGCNIADELCASDAVADKKQLWVFMQFNVPEEGEKIESYYYFGKISGSLYEKISSNAKSSGFVKLEDVRYWGEDDLVHEYRDNEYTGELVFKIEHLARVKVLKMDPMLGFKESELDDAAPVVEPEGETPNAAS
ncbi:hypothetical protein [Alkalimarinus coralli]|uniref:hypothetical protein n=1 Tax=Alkalimarinus coralli TaxID=2935863 RepID=UPI00202B5ED8|nr:hypothetical protein [Alkalimarinus coralli]